MSAAYNLDDVDFPRSFMEKMDELVRVDEQRVGVNGKWDPIEALLFEHGLMRIEKDVPVAKVLVHNENRQKFMLSPLNAHSRLALIKQVGCKKSAIEEFAIATQLCPLNPHKSKMLNDNIDLVAASNGLLASVKSDEWLCSLGSSHATAGFKAAFAGCITPEDSLHGPNTNGAVDVEGWAKLQPDVAVIRDSGFDWKVIHWKVPLKYPMVPDLASRKYNGNGAVSSGRSELEVCANIARNAQMMRDRNVAVDWDACQKSATVIPAACNAYSEVLKIYAHQYCGGTAAPLLYKLEKNLKTMASTVNLGEDLWKAITYTKWSEWEPRILIRQAILGVAYTCTPDRIKDGMSKIFVPADIQRLSSKKSADDITIISSMMETARSLVNARDVLDPCIHNLDGRLILRITGKEKWGFDTTVYPSYMSIGKCFGKECHDLGIDVEVPAEWAGAELGRPHTARAAPIDSDETTMLDLDLDNISIDVAGSPAYILGKAGYVVGAILVTTDTQTKERSFHKITSVSDAVVELDECVPYGPLRSTSAAPRDIVKTHRLYKNNLQSQVEGWIDVLPCKRDQPKIDAMRSRIYIAVHRVFDECGDCWKHLMLLQDPRDLRAREDIAKGTLKLAPAVSFGNIVTAKKENALFVTELLPPIVSKRVQFYIVGSQNIPKKETDCQWVCPYFLVMPHENNAECNMQKTSREIEIDGVTLPIPLLTNCKRIKKWHRVLVHKPAVVNAKGNGKNSIAFGMANKKARTSESASS